MAHIKNQAVNVKLAAFFMRLRKQCVNKLNQARRPFADEPENIFPSLLICPGYFSLDPDALKTPCGVTITSWPF